MELSISGDQERESVQRSSVDELILRPVRAGRQKK